MKWSAKPKRAAPPSADDTPDPDKVTVPMGLWGAELKKQEAAGRRVIRMECDWTRKRITLIMEPVDPQGNLL